MSLDERSGLSHPELPPTFAERAAGLRRDAPSAVRLFREREWVKALAAVVFLSICFVLLGRWQFDRHLSRSARNDQVTSNYAASPVALSSALPGARIPAALQWRPVSMSGTYLVESTVLIRNRPYSVSGADNSTNGYEVVVPLQLTTGRVLLIDRGWIPASATDALKPDTVPAPPPGTVTVVARLRPSEPASSRKAPAGQAITINAGQLSARLPVARRGSVINGFAVLASETPPAASTPSELDPPDPGIGINLAYAVQWWLFAITAYGMLGWFSIKEVRRRRDELGAPSGSRSDRRSRGEPGE